MATFIPGDQPLRMDPVLYTPDYNFLRYVLQKKDAQYEQGLKSVSGTIGSLKKEMSDPTNVQRRDEYFKLAESQLKKISSADLSLQQNVNSANAIFDPIATDPGIVYDMYHTANNRKQLAAMESWASSDDMATRKKFNPEIYNWVKKDLDSLKNGNGDINSYKVQGRKAFAYIDAQDIINEAAKQQGFKTEKDDKGNPYLITTTEGPDFAPNYKVFAENVLGANSIYQQQLSILGQAANERVLDEARFNSAYADLSQTQILKKYFTDNYDKDRKENESYLSQLTDDFATQRKELLAYGESNRDKLNSDSKLANAYAQKVYSLESQEAQLENQRRAFNTRFGSDNTAKIALKEKYVTDAVNNPEGFFAQRYKLNDIMRFSNMRSASFSQTIKADQAYLGILNARDKSLNTINNIKDDQFDNKIDAIGLGIKTTETAYKLQGKDSKGERTKNSSGENKEADIEFAGNSQTQVTVQRHISNLNNSIALNTASAIQELTSPVGGLAILESMGVKPEAIGFIRQYYTRSMIDPKTKIRLDESNALSEAYRSLFAFAKNNNSADVVDKMRDQVKEGVTKDKVDIPSLLRMAVKNYTPKNENEIASISALIEYEKNLSQVNNLSGQLEVATNSVISNIIKDPKKTKEFSNVIVNDNGKNRVVDPSDIVKKLPSKGWMIKGIIGNNPTTLTEEDKKIISNGMFSGTLNVEVNGRGNSDSGEYFETTFEYKGESYRLRTDEPIIPATKELNSKLNKLNEMVPIPALSSEEGVIGAARFYLRNDLKENMRIIIAGDATTTSSNIIDGDTEKQVDPEMQKKVRAAIGDKKMIDSGSMYIIKGSPLNNGGQVVSITFPQGELTSDGKPKNEIAGKTFYFPINVDSKSPEIIKVFDQMDQLDEWMNVSNKNKPYVMDHFEGLGIKVEVIPSQPGSKVGTVKMYSKFNPDSSKYEDEMRVVDNITFDLNKITFSELKQEMFQKFIMPSVKARMSYNKQVSVQGFGVESIINRLRK
jgi:hypothetical protein